MMHLLRIAASSALLSLTLGLAAPANAGEIVDRVVAVVNETIVTESDLVRFMPIYVQVMGVDPRRLESAEGRSSLASELAEYLIVTRLMIDDARARELTIVEGEIDAYVRQQRESMGLSLTEFQRELGAQGIELDDFRDFIRGNLTRVRLMQIDIGSLISVSDEDVERAMSERYPDGLYDTFITTSHILVAVGSDASLDEVVAAADAIALLRDRLASGEAFEDLAAEVNPDGTRLRGGRIGRFRTTELDPAFSQAAVNLETGEISDPVRTTFGYHLIRLDAIEREEVSNLDALRERVFYELYEEASTHQQNLYLDRVRSQGFVEVRVTEFNYK